MNTSGFHDLTLPLEYDLFRVLSESVEFEVVAKGRKADQLVLSSAAGVPLVRTTTRYNKPAHPFGPAHIRVSEAITRAAGEVPALHHPDLRFNNAMIEVYGREYHKMGFHSDQCLDLADDSFIALFSCYERPNDLSVVEKRKLKVKHKLREEAFELVLEHNSVVLFSVGTNAQFLHKIVLDSVGRHKLPPVDNHWLGITFRLSKTMVRFEDGMPVLANGQVLTLANEGEQQAFYKLRGEENRSVDFKYPAVGFTLSVGDVLENGL